MNESPTDEKRVRVIFNLPISNIQEKLAVDSIISYLHLQRVRRVTLSSLSAR